jgi:hypothetical protein
VTNDDQVWKLFSTLFFYSKNARGGRYRKEEVLRVNAKFYIVVMLVSQGKETNFMYII